MLVHYTTIQRNTTKYGRFVKKEKKCENADVFLPPPTTRLIATKNEQL